VSRSTVIQSSVTDSQCTPLMTCTPVIR
jgi:hypothetical protein